MCYDEFNRLFCRCMFKAALINTINSLQKPSTTAGNPLNWKTLVSDLNTNEHQLDARENFSKEMPLSLKIEKYQR